MQDLLSEIQLFAGHFIPQHHVVCGGQKVSIATNSALFSMMGTHYGGDGRTYFNLPDVAPLSDGIQYNIEIYSFGYGPVSNQVFGINVVGEIGYLGAQFTPRGWAYCEGQSLKKTEFPDLFNVIGYSYGGSGDEFNLPNLSPIPPKSGSKGDTKAMIRLALDPHAFANGTGILASIVQWSGSDSLNTHQWRKCNGQEMKIADYPALYSLLGTTFGGNGSTTFHLPDISTGNKSTYLICIQGIFPTRN